MKLPPLLENLRNELEATQKLYLKITPSFNNKMTFYIKHIFFVINGYWYNIAL